MSSETAAALWRLCPVHGVVRASAVGLCPHCTVACPVCGTTYERDPGLLPPGGPRVRICDGCYEEFMDWAKKKKGLTDR